MDILQEYEKTQANKAPPKSTVQTQEQLLRQRYAPDTGFFKGKGFTLIELLVVISIISLLASIVFASLNSARGKARYARILGDFDAIRTAAEFDYDSRGFYAPDVGGSVNPFLGGYLSVWPTPPCASGWNYDWDNWGSRVKITLRNGGSGIYYFCVASLPDSCFTGSDPATDINTLASKSISC